MSRHGAYLCVSAPPSAHEALATLAPAVVDVTSRLGLRNEFAARDGHPPDAMAFLRRVEATPADIEDEALLSAGAVVHLASSDPAKVSDACTAIARLLPAAAHARILAGVVAPTRYTGGAMQEFAYAHQRAQEAGDSMPAAFLLPLRKTHEWWAKDWMERHTYFLPRYDEEGRMVRQGHPLAASAGIAALMRRTYRCADRVSEDGYDFLTYFECADTDVPVFDAVCAALRDVNRNPEWRFVREGPTWRGRRVESWRALWTTS